jgi:hypothetical protein
LSVALDCPRERGLERGHLVSTTDEARESAGARHVELRAQLSDSLKLVDPYRLLHSLEGEAPEILQGYEAVGERSGVLAQVSLPRLGDLLHPGPEARGVPERRVVHPQVVVDLCRRRPPPS